MIELDDAQIAQTLQGIKLLPQPQVLVDLQIEQSTPKAGLNQIAQLVRQDVSLAGTALKFVNSAQFQLAQKTLDITNAVSILGWQNITKIVNGLSQKGVKGEMPDETIVTLTKFWDSAFDIATVCEITAKKFGLADANTAYALGLFHNSGMPLMMLRYEDYSSVMKNAYASQDCNLVDLEMQHYNTNHAVLGYYTAKSWNLPKYFCNLIAEHHNTTEVLGSNEKHERKMLLAILKLSEHLCGICQIFGNQFEDFEWNKICHDVLDTAGLTDYDIVELQQSISDLGINIIGHAHRS